MRHKRVKDLLDHARFHNEHTGFESKAIVEMQLDGTVILLFHYPNGFTTVVACITPSEDDNTSPIAC